MVRIGISCRVNVPAGGRSRHCGGGIPSGDCPPVEHVSAVCLMFPVVGRHRIFTENVDTRMI